MFTSIRLILHRGLSCLIFLMIAPVDGHAQIDDNNNGASDVWEAIHGPLLAPDADDDADGFTHRQEALAGTNPNDPADHPRFSKVSTDEMAATLALWFGVAPADLPLVLPNIGRFPHPDLGFMQT